MGRCTTYILILGFAGLAACGTDLKRTNPLDSKANPERQATAEVAGIIALAGETDFSGVDIILDGPDARSVATGPDGSFRLTDLQPGSYTYTVAARYFSAVTATLDAPIGSKIQLPAVTLAPLEADVRGQISTDDGNDPGGALITLTRTKSVRAGASESAPAFAAQAAVTQPGSLHGVFNALTLRDGLYSFADVPAGLYTLTAWKEGQSQEATTVWIDGSSAVLVPAIALKPLTGQFAIMGKLADGTDSSKYTAVRNVELDLDGFNASTMAVAEEASDGSCLYTESVPFSASASFNLSAGDGLKTICVQFADETGRVTPHLRSTIVLDQSAPTVTAFQVGDGADYIQQYSFALQAAGLDNMSGIAGIELQTPAGLLEQTFAPSIAYAVTADGTYQFSMRLADAAGNRSAWSQQTVTVDTEVPVFSATLSGLESISGRTASQVVQLELSGISTDTTSMRISNQSSLLDAAWQPVSATSQWLVLPVDGLKTVYVQIQDGAGNTSTILAPQITLDQTGPESPVLLVASVDGDLFALSATEAELSWNAPVAGDLYGFELERYVYGQDSNFKHLADLGLGSQSYVDDVTASLGYVHSYRIRAYDDLGNRSPWSAIATALPFAAPGNISWVHTTSGLQYAFPPESGTFSMQAQYSYETTDGEVQTEVLPYNFTNFKRYQSIAPGELRWAESIQLQTSNQDNNLVYDTTFPLNVNNKEQIRSDFGTYTYTATALDSGNNPHVAYYSNNDYAIIHKYIKDGQWQEDVIFDQPSNWGQVALDIDKNDVVHAAYVDGPSGELTYGNNASGGWSVQYLFVHDWSGNGAGLVAERALIANDVDHVYIANYNWSKRDLEFLTNESGTWVTYTVDDGGANQVGEHQGMAVDANGVFHIAYQDITARTVKYAYGTTAGWTVSSFPDTADSYGYENDIVVRPDGSVAIATINTSQGQYEIIDNQSGNWVTTVVNIPVYSSTYGSFFADSESNLHLITYDSTAGKQVLTYANNTTGSFGIEYLENSPQRGLYASGTIDRTGKLHFSYFDQDKDTLHYMSYVPELKTLDTIYGPSSCGGSHASTVFDAANNPHIAFYANASAYYTRFKDGQWQTEVIDNGGADQVGFNTAIAVGPDGTRHVAYMNVTDFDLYYAHNDGTGWVTERLDNGGGKVGYYSYWAESDIVVDANGYVHISYNNRTDSPAGLYYITNKSGSWVKTAIHSLYTVESTSIRLDSQDNPHIGYTGSNRLYYAEFNGTSWSTTNLGYSEEYASLVLDSSDNAHIAHQSLSSEDLLYTTNESGTWSTTTIDNSGRVGQGASIDIASDGTLHVHHRNFTTSEILYLTRVRGHWRQYTIYESGYLDGPRSMVLDHYDHPTSVFRTYGCTNSRLYFGHDYQGTILPSSSEQTTPF